MKNGWKQPVVESGKLTKWGWLVLHKEGLRLGENVDIGAFTLIDARHGVEIGNSVLVGSHCAIYSYVASDGKQGKVVLDDGCKIGSHCVVMPGVTVGVGAQVGACSFVNRDVPPDVTVFGAPARIRDSDVKDVQWRMDWVEKDNRRLRGLVGKYQEELRKREAVR